MSLAIRLECFSYTKSACKFLLDKRSAYKSLWKGLKVFWMLHVTLKVKVFDQKMLHQCLLTSSMLVMLTFQFHIYEKMDPSQIGLGTC